MEPPFIDITCVAVQCNKTFGAALEDFKLFVWCIDMDIEQN